MLAFRTTGRLIQTYAESEPWKESHDRVLFCGSVEELLGWGVRLFRDLAEIVAEIQARAVDGKVAESNAGWAEYERAFRSLVAAAENFLKIGMDLSAEGYEIGSLDEFRRALEEARCQVELWDLEAELPPIEAMRPLARPENPRPSRYGT